MYTFYHFLSLLPPSSSFLFFSIHLSHQLQFCPDPLLMVMTSSNSNYACECITGYTLTGEVSFTFEPVSAAIITVTLLLLGCCQYGFLALLSTLCCTTDSHLTTTYEQATACCRRKSVSFCFLLSLPSPCRSLPFHFLPSFLSLTLHCFVGDGVLSTQECVVTSYTTPYAAVASSSALVVTYNGEYEGSLS
jgi:hypothetical protein